MPDLLTAVQYGVFGIFAVAVAAAAASWLVRTQRVSPFTALGRGLKKFSDPLLKPVESRVYRAGGNPVRAGWWLVIGVAVAGVLVISLLTWLVEAGSAMRGVSGGGPRQVIAMLVEIAYNVVFIALLARVILSWMGIGRYTKWMRPAYWLTDWLVEPIRRVLPRFGPLDWSPLAAVLALMLLRWVLLLVL